MNYRINHGDVTGTARPPCVAAAIGPKLTTWCWALRSVDANPRGDEEEGPVGRGTDPGLKANAAAKSAFLSNMSHDIRTPMNAMWASPLWLPTAP